MKKLSNINENIWGGMLNRGSGEKVRKEDDVNNMDTEEFAEYLKTHYKVKNDLFGIRYTPSESIHVDLFCDLKNNSYRGVYINVDDHKLYTTQNSIRQWPEHLLRIINKKYERIDTIEYVYIKPKRHKVDNKFFLDFIDTIISNSETPLLKKIDVNESTWGGMLDRGSGETIRKEDDVDNMDPETFEEYLKTLYKPLADYAFIIYASDTILVPIIRRGTNSSVWFTPDKGLITIGDDIVDCSPGLLNKLEHIYMIDEHTIRLGKIYIITPKDGSEVTNSFFIEVVNFLLKNIPDSGNGFRKSLKIIDKNHK